MDLFAALSFIELGLWFLFYNPHPRPPPPTLSDFPAAQRRAEQPTRRESPARASSVPPTRAPSRTDARIRRPLVQREPSVELQGRGSVFPERQSESCGPTETMRHPTAN